MTPRKLADDLAELRDRLTDALSNGGLWNPELLEPQKLSLLLLNARDGLDSAVEALVRGAVPPATQEHERCQALKRSLAFQCELPEGHDGYHEHTFKRERLAWSEEMDDTVIEALPPAPERKEP